MNELSEEARHIGAVNVVRIGMRKGKPHLKGFNSDVIGFTRSIEPLLEPIRPESLNIRYWRASKSCPLRTSPLKASKPALSAVTRKRIR